MKTVKNDDFRRQFSRFSRNGSRVEPQEGGFPKRMGRVPERDFGEKSSPQNPRKDSDFVTRNKLKGQPRRRGQVNPKAQNDGDEGDFFHDHAFDEPRRNSVQDKRRESFKSPTYPKQPPAFRSERNGLSLPREQEASQPPKPAERKPTDTPLQAKVFGDTVQTLADYTESYFVKDVEKTVMRSTTACLQGTSIGIDVRYWLRRLEPHREPLFSFARPQNVGESVCITKHMMLQELLRFRDMNVTVLLVLNGMERSAAQKTKDAPPIGEVPQSHPSDGRRRIVHHASAPNDVFGADHVLSELLEMCWEYRTSILSHVQCIRAPGDALPQLSYYAAHSIVDHVFGPPWLFWTETRIPNRIIVDIRDDTMFYTDRSSHIAALTEKAPQDGLILRRDGTLLGVTKAPAVPSETMLLHLTIGLLSPSLLDAAATLRVVDNKPLYDSREIRQALESILPLRTQMIRMLLKNQRGHTHVQWVRPYAEDKPTVIALPPAIELDEWELEGVEFPRPPSFAGAVSLLSHKAYTRNPYTTTVQYSYALHLKFLDFLGYFLHRDIRQGRQMFPHCERGVFSEALVHTHSIFAQSMVLFIELVRTKSLSWDQLQNAKNFSFFGNPFRTSARRAESEETEAILLSRLFSFVPVEFEDDCLTHADTASADLKAFWEILQTFRGTLMQVAEVISVVELPVVEFGEDLVHEVFGFLPFKRVPSPALGAVMEHLIVVLQSGSFQTQSKEAKLQYLKTTFPHIKNLPYTLTMGFQWVDETLRVMQHLFDFMEDEEPQSTKEYICRLVFVLRQAKFFAEKIKLQIFD